MMLVAYNEQQTLIMFYSRFLSKVLPAFCKISPNYLYLFSIFMNTKTSLQNIIKGIKIVSCFELTIFCKDIVNFTKKTF